MSPSEDSPSASPPAKKQRKSKEPKLSNGASENSGSAKPLARAILVCKRCRSKKIKCDQSFPSCGSCVKAGEPCVGLDPATGREVSRSYISELEHQVSQLRNERAYLQEQLALISQPSHSSTSSSNGWKKSLPLPQDQYNGHVACESPYRTPYESVDQDVAAEQGDLYSLTANPAKRKAIDEARLDGGDLASSLISSAGGPRLVLGPGGVGTIPVAAPKANRSLRPSLRQLNSYASGLSPARLLCQAIQQSASAGLSSREGNKSKGSARALTSAGAAEGLRQWRGARSVKEGKDAATHNNAGASSSSGTKPPHDPRSDAGAEADTENGRGSIKIKQEQSEVASLESSNNGALGSASPGGGSSTPLDGKKQSSFDDADLQYAKTTETSDITVPGPEQLSKPSPLPAPFPPLPTARKLVDAYFERVNPQLPILDRASFMPRFEAAFRDGIARAKSKLQAEGKEASAIKEDEVEIELQPADGHLFHLVLAIAAAMGWTRSIWSAENHHEAAMRYLDPRRGGVGAIMGRDPLEQLQCLLLTALYSIMRTMKPGVWYCLGVALRLTTGLGLYSESSGLLESSSAGTHQRKEPLSEKKRRLFWCAYALDRQVCVHLGRPFGIADPDIKVNLPWVSNDYEMMPSTQTNAHRPEDDEAVDETLSSSGHDERASDTSTDRKKKEAASTLAALGEAVEQPFPRPKDPSRWISLSFFRMRILQSEIQGLLYQNAELPRRFSSFDHWKSDMLGRLHAWRLYAPCSKEELEQAGCGYNPIFLELNFQQTLLMIYGMSPRFPSPDREDLGRVEHCSRSIINIYALLAKEGQMNYTWMTGHNIFIACTSYLYAIWQSSATAPSSLHTSMSPSFANKVEEIDHFAKACDKVLASLQWSTAEKCRKCLKTMFAATMGVVEKLDRMIATRIPGSKDAAEQRGRGQASAERRWASYRPDSPGGWGTSDMRSQRPAESPGLSARSLYSQEGPNRYQSSGRTPKGPPSVLPPVPSWPSNLENAASPPTAPDTGSAYVNRTQQLGRPFQLSPKMHMSSLPSPVGRIRSDSHPGAQDIPFEPSFAQAYIHRGASHDARPPWTSGSPRYSSYGQTSFDSAQRYTQQQHSPDSHGASMLPPSATTPSTGLDLDSMSRTALLRGSMSTSPGGPISSSSPSNFDLSSLMATSAMELDQLFREAGLSIGLEAGIGMPTSTCEQPADTPAIQPLTEPNLDNIIGMMPPNPPSSDDGFENDWEALGFGFRMNTTRPVGINSEGASIFEFDQRQLDSNAGF